MLLAERKANTLTCMLKKKKVRKLMESHLKANRKHRVKQGHDPGDNGPP
jgi:hypothetical protein